MRLKIQTTDNFGEKYENIFLAKKEVSKVGTKYSYIDKNINTKIYILKDTVKIIRDGEIISTQLLKKDKVTEFIYKTSHMNRKFEILTKELVIANNKISAVYAILEGLETVNELSIEICEL